jgi:putative transcriptional regulator
VMRSLRELADMSQAVSARTFNLLVGYVSQLERGAKRPADPAFAFLTSSVERASRRSCEPVSA